MATTAEDLLRQSLMYRETLETVPNPMAEMLEKYSGIPPGPAQIDHVLHVRKQAYKARAYPCLGRFRFLEIDLAKHPLYSSYVLPAMRKELRGQTDVPLFLELGTCLGQDIRKLIFDGADPERCFGTDILLDFVDAGYELFQDEDRLSRDHFVVPADIFDNSSENPLNKFTGKVDIIHATAVFHLFSKAQQEDLARRCLELLDRSPGRRLILGSQVGHVDGIETARGDGAIRFRHNEQSWRDLWLMVCGEEQLRSIIKKVEVKASLYARSEVAAQTGEQQKHIGSVEDGYRWMQFEVWITF